MKQQLSQWDVTLEPSGQRKGNKTKTGSRTFSTARSHVVQQTEQIPALEECEAFHSVVHLVYHPEL